VSIPVGDRRAIGDKMTAYVQGVDATGWKSRAHQSAMPTLKTVLQFPFPSLRVKTGSADQTA
jgi:hypothetical protein